MANPYDELRYPTTAIDLSAPERLALTSLLHGGPRSPRSGYRVLELGCGNGGNLLPMAWYRRHAELWGIDGALEPVREARARAAALGLDNVELVHAGFEDADERLDPELRFDYILAHGVLSWVSDTARDALLRLCAQRLRPGGLVYLNYNTLPGWGLRGMVRDFLLAQTAGEGGLRARSEAARAVAARLADALDDDDPHPYRRLMANELRLVRDSHVAYVAHEYLSPHNRAYWRHEMLARLAEHGLTHVAEADFDRPWERGGDGFVQWLRGEGIVGHGLEDTVDLLRYRQLSSPVLTRAPWERCPITVKEMASLDVASCLRWQGPGDDGDERFEHPNGTEVTVQEAEVVAGLRSLAERWPQARPVGDAFPDVAGVLDDLVLLHANGLVELRSPEVGPVPAPGELARLEVEQHGHWTDARHHRRAPDEA